jgi:hypothetical protein
VVKGMTNYYRRQTLILPSLIFAMVLNFQGSRVEAKSVEQAGIRLTVAGKNTHIAYDRFRVKLLYVGKRPTPVGRIRAPVGVQPLPKDVIDFEVSVPGLTEEVSLFPTKPSQYGEIGTLYFGEFKIVLLSYDIAAQSVSIHVNRSGQQ